MCHAVIQSKDRGVLRFSEKQEALKRRFQGEDIPNPKNGEPGLITPILKACQYNADNRFVTAKEFLDELEKVTIEEDAVLFEVENANNTQSDSKERESLSQDEESTVYLNAGSNEKQNVKTKTKKPILTEKVVEDDIRW